MRAECELSRRYLVGLVAVKTRADHRARLTGVGATRNAHGGVVMEGNDADLRRALAERGHAPEDVGDDEVTRAEGGRGSCREGVGGQRGGVDGLHRDEVRRRDEDAWRATEDTSQGRAHTRTHTRTHTR